MNVKNAANNALGRPSTISMNVLGSIAAPSLTMATFLILLLSWRWVPLTPVSEHFNQVGSFYQRRPSYSLRTNPHAATVSRHTERHARLSHFLGSVGACNLILHIHGQLTAVKTWYPLTSITWSYCDVSCPPIEIAWFFFHWVLHWQVYTFRLIAGPTRNGFRCNVDKFIVWSRL